ncbi:bacteriohemerythrin [Thermodesulfobacterium sp. TA1]|uniref:bacteriohemerythrin n=1 Tax=Thermodesulfobacterium sp. TA1 TaxID=2234087 RepID=UPI001231CD0D|nr:bacteriohemerythrin [Thermodesulfobacterium sp. TA1]QER42272.1 bacteriohemerythrin [Thermodesulfobacterium sp. TA1]
MSFLDWNDTFLTGIKEIDMQHKKMFNMVNALYEAVRLKVDKNFLKSSLDTLKNYFENHFKFEEEMLEKYGYPEAEKHKEEHSNFKKDFTELVSQEEINFTEILKYLKNWWINHLLNHDKKYGSFLIDKK